MLKVVNGVLVAVNRGEVLGLVGESGCGESAVARMLLGLLSTARGEMLPRRHLFDPEKAPIECHLYAA